jgi:release factor glutamine methyltransferase
MQQIIKRLVTVFYKPLLAKYLSSERSYRYGDIRLVIPPEVFHPGFFFSTRFLLRYIDKQPLDQRVFLELGAGSGLMSIFAAKKGARVTATDINRVAIGQLGKNQLQNGVTLEIIHSDLFNDVPARPYDIIAVNPPYFKKNPVTPIDHAWYCGENGEYFDRFFKGLGAYVHGSSQVLMVLSDGCDLEMIGGYAHKYGWNWELAATRKNLMETLFIYTIHRTGRY